MLEKAIAYIVCVRKLFRFVKGMLDLSFRSVVVLLPVVTCQRADFCGRVCLRLLPSYVTKFLSYPVRNIMLAVFKEIIEIAFYAARARNNTFPHKSSKVVCRRCEMGVIFSVYKKVH